MSEREKIYIGKAKYHQFRDGGEIMKISITPDGVEAITRNTSATGWSNLIVAEMRQPDQRGNTHTVYIDDYVPSGGGNGGGRQNAGSERPQRGDDQQRGRDSRNDGGSRGRNDGGFNDPPTPGQPYRPQDGPGYDPDEDIPF